MKSTVCMPAHTCAVFGPRLVLSSVPVSPATLQLVTFGPFVTLCSANFFQSLPFSTNPAYHMEASAEQQDTAALKCPLPMVAYQQLGPYGLY